MRFDGEARREIARGVRTAYVLAKWDIQRAYARSVLGPFWLLLTPAAMLAIYWCVFGLALGVSWSRPDGAEVGFVPPFFAGLVVYLYVSETVLGSLRLYVSRRNFVQRSTLKLWIIWLGQHMRATFGFLINLAILFVIAAVFGVLTIGGALWGLAIAALVILVAAGVSVVLSLVGPFLGDVETAAPIAMRALFYSAPITYPLAIIPEEFRGWLYMNPLTTFVLSLRGAVVFGEAPRLGMLVLYIAVAALLMLAGIFVMKRVGSIVPDVV